MGVGTPARRAAEAKARRELPWLLYQPYKWLIFLPLLILSTCFFVGLGAVFVFLFDDRVANRTTGVWWSRFNSFITPMRVTVTGRENIGKGQSYIVASNHQSSYDIFVLFGWLGIDLKWVIKTELKRYPVFGYAVEKGGNIVIDRSNPKEAYRSLEKARQKATGGTSIIMLPEGTRSRTGELGEFKKGAFVLARDLGLPILPVTITGTREILPPKTLDLFPGRATMKIHAPVDIDEYDDESLDRLSRDVRDIIQRGLTEQ
ncbi:MAG: 1-acyl-sn-glycerol-3-phosphate acyltransferase [Actinobacteria bacterium]|nr:MAG: 1-acyl-sn-glycerol-3-phosphate acyltransferase [Actinomycetota bacterium]